MEVWVTTINERHEGGDVIGVADNAETAKSLGDAYCSAHNYRATGSWQQHSETVWKKNVNTIGYLMIQRFEVAPLEIPAVFI